MVEMFEVIGEGFYDSHEDKLFLPKIDPEDSATWPSPVSPEDADYEAEQYDDGYDVAERSLRALEAAYGLLDEPCGHSYGPTHDYWEES